MLAYLGAHWRSAWLTRLALRLSPPSSGAQQKPPPFLEYTALSSRKVLSASTASRHRATEATAEAAATEGWHGIVVLGRPALCALVTVPTPRATPLEDSLTTRRRAAIQPPTMGGADQRGGIRCRGGRGRQDDSAADTPQISGTHTTTLARSLSVGKVVCTSIRRENLLRMSSR